MYVRVNTNIHVEQGMKNMDIMLILRIFLLFLFFF